jgi:hypothetical protein
VDGLQWHVARGERREALEELSKILAKTVEDAQPQYISALSGRLQEVLREIDEIKRDTPDEMSPVDEMELKRAQRKNKAQNL